MNKKIFVLVFAVILAIALSLSTSYAMMGYKSQGKTAEWGIEGKFFKMAKRILTNRDELGLSDDQVKEIKALKAETKKGLIKQDAEIKTLGVEIDTLMWETPFDAENVNNLIAEKYKLKKDRAKYIVSAHDKLNKILTKEQLKKVGTMCK
jgi:Spy/CpxP family protein refolding chaperone